MIALAMMSSSALITFISKQTLVFYFVCWLSATSANRAAAKGNINSCFFKTVQRCKNNPNILSQLLAFHRHSGRENV